jgi:hypothetical protein
VVVLGFVSAGLAFYYFNYSPDRTIHPLGRRALARIHGGFSCPHGRSRLWAIRKLTAWAVFFSVWIRKSDRSRGCQRNRLAKKPPWHTKLG